ncbi:LLM class flavin-dependent oxidoreductase [Thermoleophilum album]|uniref:Luciferase family oxidoreductase, group 1 n=1 Tax=Thermoleophilum album TaxID=29539 RepID=A0A1H6FLI9_THEAL|nr:LLM class flavin-dependent oxidoreductase [Thermoleophilum album]SEH11747.1 luciferase family oxidoreductase, group 1 [Thermoleophilum album]
MSVVRLSVLDQSPISEGSDPAEALRNSVDLARRCDELGYHRYWVAEHHATPALACASPEALIGPIAQATTGIRVGSGGVMLPHYSPLKVAETFSTFAGLFPGRIDLGIGRAPGTDAITAYALQRDRRQPAPDDFPEQLAELLGYLRDGLPADHPFTRYASLLPGLPERPEVWLLGSSPQSAVWAADLGLPYAFADFINPHGAAIVADYRLRCAQGGIEPRVAVGVLTLCAETDEEAERLAAPARMLGSLLRRGQLIPVPTVERALAYLAGRPRRPGASGRRAIVGSPGTVRRGLEEVAREYRADELILLTICHDHADRVRSYELIAAAFALTEGARTTIDGELTHARASRR